MPDTLYENQTTDNASFNVAQTGWFAQGFTPSTSHDITSVSIKVSKGLAPGTVLVDIYSDNGSNEPDITGGVLASGSFDGDALTGTPTETNVLVSGAGSSLLSGTKYWLLLRLQNEGMSSGNLCQWRKQSVGDPYAAGNIAFSFNAGSSWTQRAVEDFWFKEYGIESTPGTPVDITGTIAATSTVSGAVDVGIGIPVTGTIAAVSTVSGAIIVLDTSELTGTIMAVSTVSGAVSVSSQSQVGWPLARRSDYAEDVLWDDATDAWYADTTAIGAERLKQAGGRYRTQLVVVSDRGIIFFEDI